MSQRDFANPTLLPRLLPTTHGEQSPAESTFHVVTTGERVLGIVRTLVGAFSDLPIATFEAEWESDAVLEYASLAVAADARKLGITEALFRSVWHQAWQAGCGVVAITEEWLFKVLRDHYAFNFRQLGPSKWYLGGECLPIGATYTAAYQRLPLERPKLWSYLLEGLNDQERSQLPLAHGRTP